MSELNLSPDAHHRLGRCYSLFLRWADEAEKNVLANSEFCEGNELSAATGVDEVTRLDYDAPDVELEQTEDTFEMNVNEIIYYL